MILTVSPSTNLCPRPLVLVLVLVLALVLVFVFLTSSRFDTVLEFYLIGALSTL